MATTPATTSNRSDQQRLMDGIFWYGIPTLFRCDYDPDPNNADIALVGVPHSTGNGTTQRDQHLGPRARQERLAHSAPRPRASSASTRGTCAASTTSATFRCRRATTTSAPSR